MISSFNGQEVVSFFLLMTQSHFCSHHFLQCEKVRQSDNIMLPMALFAFNVGLALAHVKSILSHSAHPPESLTAKYYQLHKER